MQSKQDRTSPKDFSESIAQLDEMTTLRARAWVDEGRRVWLVAILIMMVSGFLTSYFSQNKRKQGVPGLFASMNALMLPFLTYAKYWEFKRDRKADRV